MKQKKKKLWIAALEGDAAAYRKLGKRFLKERDNRLAYLCLEKAAELGDEGAWMFLHETFPEKGQAIDRASYRMMLEDYQRLPEGKEKERLGRYLKLGKSRDP